MIASAAARLTAVVVLPTPPFWFATARTRGFVMMTPELDEWISKRTGPKSKVNARS